MANSAEPSRLSSRPKAQDARWSAARPAGAQPGAEGLGADVGQRAELPAQRAGNSLERPGPADLQRAERGAGTGQRQHRPGALRPVTEQRVPASGPPGGQRATRYSAPSSAARCAGVSMSGWMRRHRLASRAANPACPASSRPPSGSASHSATATAPAGASASSSSGGGDAAAVRRGLRPPRPAPPGPPLTAGTAPAGPASAAAAPASAAARGRCWPGPGTLPGDLRGQLGQARAGLRGQVRQLVLRLGWGAAEPLHQHAPGQVHHGAGGRRGLQSGPAHAAAARSARLAARSLRRSVLSRRRPSREVQRLD